MAEKPKPPSKELHTLARRILAASASHYRVLDVTPFDVEQDAKVALSIARSRVVRLFHPDKFASADSTMSALAHDVTCRANAAHDVLADARSRRTYDLLLATTHYACVQCTGTGVRRVQRKFSQPAVYVECTACDGDGFLPKETS